MASALVKKIKGYEYAIDRKLSHRVFGHGAGIKHTAIGAYHALTAKRKQTHADANIQALRKTGVLDLGIPYDAQTMAQIRKEWASAMADNEKSVAVHEFRRQIVYPQKNLPGIHALIRPDILAVFENYYGSEIKIISVSCWRNIGPPLEKVHDRLFSNTWHCDYETTSLMKLFVCISDITADDGPFHIHPRSNTRKLMKMGYKARDNYAGAKGALDTMDGLFRLIGPSGSAAACNTQTCLHRAGVPKEGHFRDILQLQILPSRTKRGSDWTEHLIRKGAERAEY